MKRLSTENTGTYYRLPVGIHRLLDLNGAENFALFHDGPSISGIK